MIFPDIKCMDNEKNTGIIGDFIELLKNTDSDYFLFLENDVELIHDSNETKRILSDIIRCY